jgi:hypothetical protein
VGEGSGGASLRVNFIQRGGNDLKIRQKPRRRRAPDRNGTGRDGGGVRVGGREGEGEGGEGCALCSSSLGTLFMFYIIYYIYILYI